MRNLVKCKEVARGRVIGEFENLPARNLDSVFENCKYISTDVLGQDISLQRSGRLFAYIQFDDAVDGDYAVLHLFVLNEGKTYIEYILIIRNLNLRVEVKDESVEFTYAGLGALELFVSPDGSAEFENFGDLLEDLGASDSLAYTYTFDELSTDTDIEEQWRGDFYKVGLTDDEFNGKPVYDGVLNKHTGKRIMFNGIMHGLAFVSGTDEYVVLEGGNLRYKVMFPEGDETTYKVQVYNPL